MKIAFRLLRVFCPPQLLEEIEGDLFQKFERDVKLYGYRKARQRLFWNVIRFFRPEILLRNKNTVQLIQIDMILNYLKVTWRNMKRHSLYATINVMSLAIGLAAFMLIYLFIRDEFKFDSTHSNRNQIYRVNELQRVNGDDFQKVALTGSPFGPGMQSEFPEIISYTRVEPLGKQAFRCNNKQLLLENMIAADSTFFKIFDFSVLSGDRTTLLNEPGNIVLTRKSAEKFFPNASDALGKTFVVGDKQNSFIVTGLIEDVPEHSHLQFDALISLVRQTRTRPEYNTDWTGNFLFTYLLLHPEANVQALKAKLPEWLIRWTEVPDINKSFGLFLQPLSEIHLRSNDIEHDYMNYRKFNGKYLDVFAVIGVFILIIAAINFMNLTTARSSYRWKEIGIRRSIGALRIQLFLQFIFESILLACLALFVAIAIDLLFLPILNQWIGRHLVMLELITDPKIIGLFFTGSALLALLVTVYPSLYMASADLVNALKGKVNRQSKPFFQSSLVMIQFGLALALIVGTLVVREQLSFMQNQDLGFNKDQIVLVLLNKESNLKLNVLKDELIKSKYVFGVTASGQRIGNNFHQTGFNVKSENGLSSVYSSHLNVDYDYLDVYGIQLNNGRTFSRLVKTDKGKAFIINQSMLTQLQIKNPLGTQAGYNKDSLGSIIGVVDDFKFNSLHHKVSPLFMICKPEWGYDELSVKIDGKNVNEGLAVLAETWNKMIPSYPFSYSFLDDHFTELYKGDKQLSRVVTIMAILAVIVSCMGLFGLASVVTEKRTKEMGIRKVLGASRIQMVTLLSRNFVFLILVSFIVVSPIVHLLLTDWLQNFAYRVEISFVQFIESAALGLGIASLTIGYHTIKTAEANPVDSLKNE